MVSLPEATIARQESNKASVSNATEKPKRKIFSKRRIILSGLALLLAAGNSNLQSCVSIDSEKISASGAPTWKINYKLSTRAGTYGFGVSGNVAGRAAGIGAVYGNSDFSGGVVRYNYLEKNNPKIKEIVCDIEKKFEL